MAVYKDPKPTKNGRAWYFKFSYKDAFDATKQYRSKRYLTKKDASDAERMFFVTSTDKVEDNNMTFKDLYDDFQVNIYCFYFTLYILFFNNFPVIYIHNFCIIIC